MCRLLAVAAAAPFRVDRSVAALADIARRSKEYQGDGWGVAWWDESTSAWEAYHSLRPIWEDSGPAVDTRRMVAHARSAFQSEGIEIENNMPFLAERTAFVFNGELRGVRLAVPGRIGAEKLFRFVRQLGGDHDSARLALAVEIVGRRTRYLRAMNFVVAAPERFMVVSRFAEDPDYFTIQLSETADRVVICSERYPGEPNWRPVDSGAVFEVRTPG